MNLFKKAEVEEARLKIGVYGEAGSGKTYTSLKLATGLGKRIAAIDTEFNMNIYANDFSFDVIETNSLKQVLEVLKSKEIKNYDVLIVDSITHLWEDAQNSYIEYLKNSRDQRKKKRGEEGDIQFQDWKAIKKPYKEMFSLLLAMDMHVIFTGRLSYTYDYKDRQLIKSGEKMDAEKGTEYEPTILIKMVNNGTNRAIVQKDRTNTIQNKSFDNPDFSMLDGAMKKMGKKHVVKTKNDEGKSESLFEEEEPKIKDMPETESKKITDALIKQINQIAELTESEPAEVQKEELGGEMIHELTKTKASNIYKALASKIKELKK